MSAGSLAGKIAALIADPARLTIAANNINQLAKPDAARDLAEHIISLTKQERKS
jgi:UDP-N-acetylglucosamine:LPS N-acetylglucosamine transferase